MTDLPPPQVTPVWTPPPGAYGYGYPIRPPTNGMAIAAMIVSIVGIVGMCGFGPFALPLSLTGAILGHLAMARIRRTGEQGNAMALVGMILGWVGFAIGIVLATLSAAYIYFLFRIIPTLEEDFPVDPEALIGGLAGGML